MSGFPLPWWGQVLVVVGVVGWFWWFMRRKP